METRRFKGPLLRSTAVRALTYQSANDVRVETVADPILEAADAIILRMAATAICGSDLHLYRGSSRHE